RPLATRIAKYKDACSALLRSQGVNAAENIVAEPMDVDRAWAWARHLDAVTIKPNDGKQGADVHVGIAGEKNFRRVFTQVAEARKGPVLVEKAYRGKQYRCFMVNNNLVAASYMRPASVIGNGVSSIKELVRTANKARTGHPSHRKLPFGIRETDFLEACGVDPDSTPSQGERVS